MFDIHKSVHTADDSELDDRKVHQYIEGLCKAFGASPEAVAVPDEDGEWGAVYWMTEYGISYIGATPPEYSVRDFDEILFSLIPRKVSVEADRADAIVATLRAFWLFAQREYQLSNAAAILARLDARGAARLRRELSDPSNFGMAKSFFAMGDKLGFDMTTQQGLDEYLLFYNSQLASQLPPLGMPEPFPDDGFEDPPALPARSSEDLFSQTARERAERRKKRRKADKRKGGKR